MGLSSPDLAQVESCVVLTYIPVLDVEPQSLHTVHDVRLSTNASTCNRPQSPLSCVGLLFWCSAGQSFADVCSQHLAAFRDVDLSHQVSTVYSVYSRSRGSDAGMFCCRLTGR